MKKYISIIVVTLAIAASSCKKNYLELSQNPNSPTVTTPGLSLSGSLKTTADIVNGGSYIQYACWIGYLSQSTGYQPFVSLEAYQITTATYDAWTTPYLNISNYTALAGSTKEPYYQAIAKIMTVFDYQALVDNYNNVPYSQAIKGTGVLNPTYDSGSAIYDDLLKQLDAAIALIKGAPASALNPGVNDIMYGGNMTNWKKFANTLKLRIALRQSNLSAKTAALKADIAATAAEGYLDATNPALVNPGYLNSDATGGQESPLWRNYGYTQNGASQANNAQYQANSYGVAALSANGDPRDTLVYLPLPGTSTVVSTPFGGNLPPALKPSVVGRGVLKSPTMSATIMSSAEALFLEAEAVQGGYYTGSDPATLYNAAITASFVDDYVGSTSNYSATITAATATSTPNAGAAAAAATAYYSQAAIAYPSGNLGTVSAAQQQAIIVQKWKALAVYGALESFNEFRRTGYPNDIPLSVFPGANAPNQITRIPYPAVEYKTNAANVAAQGTVNIFSSKIFWAK